MCPKTPNEKEQMSKAPYSNVVDGLMYAMMSTHPYICYTVWHIRIFQSNLGQKHWMTMKRILRFLKGTSEYVLCYQRKDLRLIGYADAAWGGDLDQCKSTFGYALLLNDCAIS